MPATKIGDDAINSKCQKEDERKRKTSGVSEDEPEDISPNSEIGKSSCAIAENNPDGAENTHDNHSDLSESIQEADDQSSGEEDTGKRKQRKIIELKVTTQDLSNTHIHEEEAIPISNLLTNPAEEAKKTPLPDETKSSTAKAAPGQRIFGSGILVGGFSASSSASPFSMFSSSASSSGKPGESFLAPRPKKDDESVSSLSETETALPDHANEASLAPLQTIENVPSGEEEDNILLQLRAKLFFMSASDTKKEWKERGIGILHVNQNVTEPNLYRLVMRTDATLKLILNIRVAANMMFEIVQDKNIRFIGSDNSIPGMYLLRFKTAASASEFLGKIQDVLYDENSKSEDI